MKSKFFMLILVFLTFVGLGECVYAGLVTPEDKAEQHTCSYGSWYRAKNPTCTSSGYDRRDCSCGEYETSTVAALGHTGGSLSDNYNSSQHWRTCSRCGGGYDHASHSGGTWYPDGNSHHKDCSTCAKTKYISQIHDMAYKKQVAGNNNQHEMYCNVCWNAGYEIFRGMENHTWSQGDDQNHTCTIGNCGYEHTTIKKHSYNANNGGYLQAISYTCILTDGNPCGHTITCETPESIMGMDIDEYAATDATKKIGDVPQFEPGVYEFCFTGTLRDANGNKITSYNIVPSDTTLTGWTQRNVKTHASLWIGDLDKSRNSDTIMWGGTELPITSVVNAIENNQVQLWPIIPNCQGMAMSQINNGEKHVPDSVVFDSSGYQKFVVTYSKPPEGGWMFAHSRFFPVEQLYCSGKYKSDGGVPIYANVYYCYRTLDNQVPWNKENGTKIKTYEDMYKHSSVVVYNYGHLRETVDVVADTGLIDSTGYRYVGYTIDEGPISEVYAAKAPPDEYGSTVATVEVTSDWNQSAAIVTFFVEPVKLTYGHQARNAQSDTQTVDINIPSNQRLLKDFNSTDSSKKPLEFREYYNSSAGRCYIPVDESFSENPDPLESLYKYAWPGYILEESRVYKTKNGVLGSIIGGTQKQYYIDEEPYTTILEDSNRHIVNERIPSFYQSESRGFASDKHFAYIYNTPTLEIEHLNYKNLSKSDGSEYMKTTAETGSKPIKYTTQIVNQFAYIDSLVTDNVKDKYTMSIRNAQEKTESFEYYYPRYDLVAIRIFEKKEDSKGKITEEHYVTLYEDETYKDKMVKKYESNPNVYYQVKGYEGVFGKYYSDSLNSIANQIKEELATRKGVSKNDEKKLKEIFNTNKNWKVEFIYDEVDRVYIKFKDLKGNSVFIPSGDHYIGEVTSKLPEPPKVFEHEVINRGANDKFLLVQYTSGEANYRADFAQALSQAERTTAPHMVRESAGNGDKYYIFYYSTGNILKVEFRDKDNNPIQGKDSIITEISTTGEVVEIPKIELYELIGYKHNPEYNLTDTDISGDMINLTPSDEEISIPNPNETDHHVIIYYQPKETLTVKYKELPSKELIPVPPRYNEEDKYEIPETGMKIEVPEVPGYEVKDYVYIGEYNGIDPDTNPDPDSMDIVITTPTDEGEDINVPSNGKNQLIIIYYEKEMTDPIDLTIKFVPEDPEDPDGKPDMEDPLRDPVTIEIPKGEDVPVPVPEIDEYTPISYIEGEAPIDPIPKPDPLVGEPIVSGEGPIEVILIYRPEDEDPEDPGPDEPTIITPDDNKEKAVLHANNFSSEEYTVEVAIPTSEDLYVSGDVYSYRFTTKMPKVEEKENVKVQIIQEYYKDLDNLDDRGTVSTDILDIEISYKYYDIQEAYLYDLKSLHLENGAIKYYDNYKYNSATDIVEHGYSEKEANFKIRPKPEPKIVYEPTESGVVAVGENEESNKRVQITSGNGYDVKYEGGIYKIYIKDIDYYNYEELAGKHSLKEQLEIEAQAIIEKCTQIKVQKLYIQMDGEDNVDILTGEKYHLPERSEALDSTKYYIPYVAGRTPLYSFLEDKDLYVMEQALNKLYSSTLEGNYRLIDAIKDNVHLDTDEKLKNESLYDNKLTVEKIAVNPLNIHTPIIKDVTLTPNDEKTQLENVPSTVDYVLNLEERFDIKISNKGMHYTVGNAKGYGDRKYNNLGLITENEAKEEKDHTLSLYEPTVTGRKTIKQKSLDELMPIGSFENREALAANPKDEELAKGPSFAEYKLIRFPYDVYFTKTDENSPTAGGPQLFKANEWYNLNEYVKPSVETYTFTLPTWVKDATAYMASNDNGIHVLVVAENCPLEILNSALTKPMNVRTEATNLLNKDKTYILRQSYSTYVSGRLYDLQIRDTDDPGYMNKIKPALKGSTDANEHYAKEIPIAQKGQVAAYNYGLKLGYRIYFDLKTKGISNKNITIKPDIYYVSTDGNTVKSLTAGEISLFYRTKNVMYNKLTEKDLNVIMTMSGTHGITNNPGYTQETISASLLGTRDFRSQVVIGSIKNGLNLLREKAKLPYDNIVEIGKACGYTGEDSKIRTDLLTSALNNAKTADIVLTNENMIKDVTGHWYGEYYLPASTTVYNGNVSSTNIINGSAKSAELKDGYLVVVFKEIKTEDDVVAGNEDTISPNYLTYAAPSTNSQWVKEGIDTAFVLPNGNTAEITIPGSNNLIEAGAMAIYQVGLRANNDYEIEGTH